MKKVHVLNSKNVLLYAAHNYTNPRLLDVEEFHEDFNRFKYLKKLITRYSNKGILQERLILNHLIKIYNVFKNEAATNICKYKIAQRDWPILKTFLLYLNYIEEDDFINITIDLFIAEKLQQI